MVGLWRSGLLSSGFCLAGLIMRSSGTGRGGLLVESFDELWDEGWPLEPWRDGSQVTVD